MPSSANQPFQSYDTTVVGGGVIGLAIACKLAIENQKVALISPVARNATSASYAAGAMIDIFGELPYDGNVDFSSLLRIGLYSQEKFKPWIECIEKRAGKKIFHTNGIFLIANNAEGDDAKTLRRIKAEMYREQHPFEEVEPSEIPGLHPNQQFQCFDSVYMGDALTVDTTELLDAKRRFLNLTPECDLIDEQVNVIKPLPSSGEWLVETTGAQYVSQNVVIAAGANSVSLLEPDVLNSLQLPSLCYGKGVSCLVSHVPTNIPHAIRTPNRASACGLHVVPRANGQLYLGATNYFGTKTPKTETTPAGEVADVIQGCAHQISTSLAKASLQQFRHGLRPVWSSGMPIFGETRIPGLFLATGTYRVGVHLSPAIAEIVVSEILNTECAIANEFSPRVPSAHSPQTKIRHGVKSLVDVALGPSGSMPYNRRSEVTCLLKILLEITVLQDPEHEPLRQRLKSIFGSIDLEEQKTMRMLYEVLRTHLPDHGPYPD